MKTVKITPPPQVMTDLDLDTPTLRARERLTVPRMAPAPDVRPEEED